ncbi:MAG: uncharacterized protein K0R46_2625 [Herbinix sp.]|jgi:uncharacterized protein with FMN-binding domain|nr:uncharacterized protein [Herbinix sp.]
MSKGKKIIIVVFAVIVVIVIGISYMINSISSSLDAYKDYDLSGLDLSRVEDGTYTGSEDAKIIQVTVEVTVKDHVITEVNILSHQNGQGKPAEAIVDDIVAKNSLEVDAISGATHSSLVIKAAVYNALTRQS